jgi:formylglycine-generating enzyme
MLLLKPFNDIIGNSTILLISLIFLLRPASATSQSIQNIEVFQFEDTIKVKYDIYGGRDQDVFFVEIELSTDAGRTFTIFPKNLRGDAGHGISRGINKFIVWEPLKEKIELEGENHIFKIKGMLLGNSPNVEFVKVSGGTYDMGDTFGEGHTDENYVHTVTIDDFEISKFEVTNYQYALFLKDYGKDYVKNGEFKGEKMIYESEYGLKFIQGQWQPAAGYEYHPVVNVTWYGAIEFCHFFDYRLPTEAEWEYAARERGKTVKFSSIGNVLDPFLINYNSSIEHDSLLVLSDNIIVNTRQSGAYPPNELGLFNMSGNVWEWCLDWYLSNYYHDSKIINPTGPWFGTYKAVRGGSWFSSAHSVRVTDRSFLAPYNYKEDVGFRVARSLTSKK